ncbi:MAG: hypothetical protein Q4B06_00955 [Candidatus Saccharibacteria bacterium]|nr:hypothetical protein [Candidatus Saccharibacteria bacterium]
MHPHSIDPIDLTELCEEGVGLVIRTKAAERKEACFVVVPYKVQQQLMSKTVLARVYRAEPNIVRMMRFSEFDNFRRFHTQHDATIQLKRYIKFDEPVEATRSAEDHSDTARSTVKALATGHVSKIGGFTVPQDYLEDLLAGYTP